MISKPINNSQFKEALIVAFESDDQILNLYCPLVEVKSTEDVAKDIYKRLQETHSTATVKGIYVKSNLIGYYVYEGKMLLSFSLNVKYRNRKYLRDFFALMRRDLRGKFGCFLWSNNKRGILWLLKNSMNIVKADEMVTLLEYN